MKFKKSISRVIVISLLLLGFYFVFTFFNPPDWVDLDLEQVPPDVSAIYVIAKKQQDIFPLKWYSFMAYPSLHDPKVFGEQWDYTVRGKERSGHVQWESADSYGILARLKSGDWVVWWLKPQYINGPSSMRYLFGGGENVTIQVLGIETSEKAPRSLLDQISIDEP